MRKHKWIKMTIAERFPVIPMLQGHTVSNQGSGPFYAPNSEWFKLYNKPNWKHEEFSAQYWRDRGYTVSLEIVER